MSAEIAKLYDMINTSAEEYLEINWGYGKLTVHLKIMYINNVIEEVLKYVIEKKIKCSERFKDLIINKINETEKNIKDNGDDEFFTSIIRTNIYTNKFNKYRSMILFKRIDTEKEKKEYEELVKKYNPVYTILINRFKSKILKQLPYELIRYMNEFLQV